MGGRIEGSKIDQDPVQPGTSNELNVLCLPISLFGELISPVLTHCNFKYK